METISSETVSEETFERANERVGQVIRDLHRGLLTERNVDALKGNVDRASRDIQGAKGIGRRE